MLLVNREARILAVTCILTSSFSYNLQVSFRDDEITRRCTIIRCDRYVLITFSKDLRCVEESIVEVSVVIA